MKVEYTLYIAAKLSGAQGRAAALLFSKERQFVDRAVLLRTWDKPYYDCLTELLHIVIDEYAPSHLTIWCSDEDIEFITEQLFVTNTPFNVYSVDNTSKMHFEKYSACLNIIDWYKKL